MQHKVIIFYNLQFYNFYGVKIGLSDNVKVSGVNTFLNLRACLKQQRC